jgi:hypothetical protein
MALCVIQGCLNIRAGANLCAPHEHYTTHLGQERAPIMDADRIDALARRLILLQHLEQRVSQAKTDTKQELHQLIKPGTQLRPLLADGQPAGVVSYPAGATRASISDADAWGEWVMRHYPTECQLIPVPRKAFQDKVLEMSKAAGVPIGPGGEVAESAPAGVKVSSFAGAVRALPAADRGPELWAEIGQRLEELT